MNTKAQRRLSVAPITATIGFSVACPARADVVWSEDWNPSNFAINGTVTDGPVGNLTDRSGWLNVSYNVFSSAAPAAQNGWTFTGSDFLVINTTTGPELGRGALLSQRVLQHGRDRRRRGDGLDRDHRANRGQNLSP